MSRVDPVEPVDPVARAQAALDAVARSARPEAWISVRPARAVEADALEVADRLEHGDDLPLAGVTVAVKDNIDVAGTTTTAAHPAFDRRPGTSATAVHHLVEAGAVVIGKTNLDQFATGLVGTRSPYGAVRNAIDPTRVSGGSSSGSAIAVALGEVDVALGTDTAGSGRVPAALNGIVGLKPTRGLVSATGVVPACRSLDCVSVLARSVRDAAAVLGTIAGPDPLDPWSRIPPSGTPPVPAQLRIGVPRADQLAGLDADARAAWADAANAFSALGPVTTVDLTPYLDAGELLYGSALIAERWDAVGEFLEAHPDGADPTVAGLIGAARTLPAHQLAGDQDRIRRAAHALRVTWEQVDVIAVPTVGEAPMLDAVATDPVGVNARLGRFTNGANILDLCAAAVPCGTRADGIPFGVTFLAPAFADALVAVAGARLLGEDDPPAPPWAATTTVVVVGAHLTGQPLNHQLVDRGARLVAPVRTAPIYRLYALPTQPPKPGLVRVGAGGAAIDAELWELPLDGFGSFVGGVPAPLTIGTVVLEDCTAHPGFLCESWAVAGCPDITATGGWARHLAGSEPSGLRDATATPGART
jgi:allophanate hydrolase